MTERRGLLLWTMIALMATTILSFAANKGKSQRPNRPGGSQAWRDDFGGKRIDAKRWVIASGRAPGYIPGQHVGSYQPDHVSVRGGFLTMLLTQEIGAVDANPAGVVSRGALIYTKSKYGYGTYEWAMRMSSTADSAQGQGSPTSGSVSAGFIYANNSQTEIDFEFSGLSLDSLWFVNWLNPDPSTDPTEADEFYTELYPFDSTSGFHTYKFVWEPGSIAYYIDDVLQAVHIDHVPSAPAYFMINHWGTDNGSWGGVATIDVPRYFYVDWVSYTPLQ
jgi:beta-glucanase (GH16 family)